MATLYYPKGRESITKFGSLVGNTTAAQSLMVLPKDAIITGVYVIGAANATATCTLTVSCGSDADGVLAAFDLETGAGYNPAGSKAGSSVGVKLTADSTVNATLSAAVAGDAAKSWTVKVEYIVPGSGETLTS